MRQTFFKKIEKYTYPDEIYQAAYKQSGYNGNKEKMDALLQKLAVLPTTQQTIIPQLKGLLLQFDSFKESKDKKAYIIRFDELITKHREWINNKDYDDLFSRFLTELKNEKAEFYQLMWVDKIREKFNNSDDISAFMEMNSYYIFNYKTRFWLNYAELNPTLAVLIAISLYSSTSMNAWLAYLGDLIEKSDGKEQQDLAISFVKKFNLNAFSKEIVESENFEEFIDFLYKLVHKGKFLAEKFIDLIERIFRHTQNSAFDLQLQNYISDKLYYYQAKCLLCGIDKNKAIQKLESISPCNRDIYKEACYELGIFYSTVYSTAEPDKEALYQKAKEYLEKAQSYGHEASENIAEILKNMQVSTKTGIVYQI